MFSVTRLDGDQIASDPANLGDSIEALAMTAPRRLVLVKGRGADAGGVQIALARDLSAAMIVVEASDTTTRHTRW